MTPLGPVDASTAHQLPAGGKVVHIDETTIHLLDHTGAVNKVITIDTQAPTPVKRQTSGTVAQASWTNAAASPPIASFGAHCPVPSNPTTSTGQSIFIFNSLESTDGTETLAAVLQWGTSSAGGGNFWGIASWYFFPGGTIFTSLTVVAAGAPLMGNVQLVSSGSTFIYESQLTSNGVGALLEIVGAKRLDIATFTLEVSDITSNSNYPPGSMEFFDIVVNLTSGSAPGVEWIVIQEDGITVIVEIEGGVDAEITIIF